MAPAVVVHLLDAGAPLTLTVTAVAVSAGIWQMARFYQRYSTQRKTVPGSLLRTSGGAIRTHCLVGG